MTSKTSEWGKLNPKDKANLLKGDLSYAEHYGYLMDWYMNDRKTGMPHAEVRESLKDVLEALKELNAKVEGRAVCRQKPNFRENFRANLFSKLVERQNA